MLTCLLSLQIIQWYVSILQNNFGPLPQIDFRQIICKVYADICVNANYIVSAVPCPADPVIVYPKKYAHGFVVLCFVVVMQSFIMNSHEVFIHIHQGCFAGTGATFTETLRITIFLAVLVNAGCMQAHGVGYWYIPWDGQMMAWQLSYASAPLMVLFAYICLLNAASESLDTYSISHRNTPVPVKPSWRIWTDMTISEAQQNTMKCKQCTHGMNNVIYLLHWILKYFVKWTHSKLQQNRTMCMCLELYYNCRFIYTLHGFVVLCFVVVMQSFIMNSHEVFIHIHQGCFAGTGAIVRLPQCQWSKPDGYGKISQCITTTKHSKAKTVCIFLGIYCIYIYHCGCLWAIKVSLVAFLSNRSAYVNTIIIEPHSTSTI